ncbi:hypothetical protein [Myxococcus stipitatus]|uniref:hypothetical protein n=1 Tax=Myxococcus stipitatus TaxID=83455 RepID=UPI0030CC69BC
MRLSKGSPDRIPGSGKRFRSNSLQFNSSETDKITPAEVRATVTEDASTSPKPSTSAKVSDQFKTSGPPLSTTNLALNDPSEDGKSFSVRLDTVDLQTGAHKEEQVTVHAHEVQVDAQFPEELEANPQKTGLPGRRPSPSRGPERVRPVGV